MYTFTKHLLFSPSFWNKMFKFYHILLAKCNHLKGFQKLSLNIVKFQKLNVMESGALLLVKL